MEEILQGQRLIKSKQTNFNGWIITLSLLFLAGGYFIAERLIRGLEVTNLTSSMPWGAWIAFYIFFVGLSAGSFLLSSLIYVFNMREFEKVGKAALFTAIICMVVAGTFVFVDLGRPERVLNAIIFWNVTSILSWEVHFYIVYVLLLSVELYIAMREDLVRLRTSETIKGKIARLLTSKKSVISAYTQKRDHLWMKILGMIGIPLAIFGVHGGTGTLFAVVKARVGWNTALFPIIFVVSAMVSGTALLLAMYIIKRKAQRKSIDQKMVQKLSALMIAFLIVDLGLQFFEYLVGFYGLEHEHLATLRTTMASPFSWSFWGVQLFLGSLIPIVLFFWRRTRTSVNAMLAAAILIVIGIIGVRFNIVVPALIVPLFDGLPAGYYYPTLSEWMSTIGIIAFGLLLYTFGEKILPIDDENLQNGGLQHGE
ncbi:NrfD/PsrC family molybdoenzyme membrane anchor subunit [Rubeoparvulum massiliense]|uniref:NrfD/PsrC family molybdoenzyme membrane anchor subunit n=1 Tax=Rubeoparvulum massiliense TaxID=1631346 RepID=UPI00065DE594|nr:NrfD/PsrC family molybdoenzyme membrane anchor subunit [Rubeoparvulum massiliense]